ncbi:hypothetical protein [Nocardioides yefusunii]|uniref:DUF2029 domain-containing protein n=1 Tax=Nocardioides yefusunii TaxID=2500546 RepID=A0ABW1QWB4_9ACTN|nr:hypothetical protein [Nocardioides yefusunii]
MLAEDRREARPDRQPWVPSAGRRRKVALAVLLGLAVTYVLTVSLEPSLDVVTANHGSWLLAVEHTRWVPPEYLQDHLLRDVWIGRNEEHDVTSRAPGVVILGLPAYALFGGDTFSVLPAALTAALVTASAMTLLFLALSRVASLRLALVGTGVVALATPVWSVAADGIWPHTLTVFAVCAGAWAAAHRNWWALGLLLGVGIWGRSHFTLVPAVVGIWVALSRRDLGILVKIGAGSALSLCGTVLWSRWMFGVWTLTGSYRVGSVSDLTDRYEHLWSNELGLFLSPERGVLPWTPIALVCVPVLVMGRVRVPDWAWALLSAGLLYTVVQGFAQVFHGGDTFWGHRLGIEFVVCAAPSVALAFTNSGRRTRSLFAALLGVQVLCIALGSILNLPGVVAEEAWRTNAVLEAAKSAPVPMSILLLAAAGLGYGVNRRASRDSMGADVF